MNINDLDELKELVEYIRPIALPSVNLDAVWYFIGQDKKINAIKAYRKYTGDDLKTAKEAVEKMYDSIPLLNDLIHKPN
jgi:hypothetical protein